MIIFLLCFIILINGQIRWLARLLGLLVATMGVCFIIAIFKMDAIYPIPWNQAFYPQMPEGSTMLIVGLIGTTIVPYNLFLGSGLARGKTISSMRLGLFISILTGGVITMSILIAGSFVVGRFDFVSLKNTIEASSGTRVANLIGVGLFCAGLSSATTAPLAAAFTLQSLFYSNDPKWKTQGKYFRITWLAVLLAGLVFSLLDFKPISVIVTAQILNGLILPFIALTLVLAMNSPKCTEGHKNGGLNNLLLFMVVLVCLALGIRSLWSVF